jgi:hypothetical protein
MNLNSIEMAVVAEVDLEMARTYEEVAGDATQRPETRRAAREAASGWRERARLNQLEARHRSAEPIVPTEQTLDPGRPYSGPDRRKEERRKGERRRIGSAVSGHLASLGRDRPVNPRPAKG